MITNENSNQSRCEELAKYFGHKHQIKKLLKFIQEEGTMIRCANIYCGTMDNITKHHVIPKPFRNRQTVEKIPLCEDCHKKVHQLATNTELAYKYNTKKSVIELLAKDVKFRVNRLLNAMVA